MKIAFFGTHHYDRDAFVRANADRGHSITFLEPRLTAQTLDLAAGHDAACLFVNDVADAACVAGLAARGVRVIAMRCAGYNNVDLDAAKRHDVAVVRVPAYSPESVAEHALALMLTLNRKTHRAFNRVREGNFSLEGMTGFVLSRRTVGVVGTGRIGLAMVRILRGIGCRVLAYDTHPTPEVTALGAAYVAPEHLLAESDIVTLHCPLLPATYHLIDAAALARMKPGAMLINTSRGALVDTAAVLESLKVGALGSLGIDVYEEEEGMFFEDLSHRGIPNDMLARLVMYPNVLVTGHQAFLTGEALATIAEVTLDNLTACERGEDCGNRV